MINLLLKGCVNYYQQKVFFVSNGTNAAKNQQKISQEPNTFKTNTEECFPSNQ